MKNLAEIEAKLSKIASNSGRNPNDISIVAISKRQPISQIENVFKQGIVDFGENRVQEFIQKLENVKLPVKWHFVGHLQSNKIKYILGKTWLIHSVDSLHLAAEIAKKSVNAGIVTNCLLQVNTSGESSKSGFAPNNLLDSLPEIEKMEGIQVKGLMTMAPFVTNEQIITNCFRELKQLFDKIKKMDFTRIKMAHLSMGMTNDFEIAVREGSNMLRLGTAIFGPRN